MSLDSTTIEEIVLRTVMSFPDTFDTVAEMLTDQDFANAKHRVLWKTIRGLVANKRPYEMDDVFHHMQENGTFDSIGGLNYYKHLADSTYAAADGLVERCKRIRQISVLRLLRNASGKIIELIDQQSGRPFEELLSEADAIFTEVTASHAGNEIEIISGPELMQGVLRDFVEASDNPGIRGISTGMQILDEQTDGLHKGEMIIVAGPPSMGKTAFAVNLIQNALYSAALPVVIFSMEMPAKDIGRRMWSTESRVNYTTIRRGKANDPEAGRMMQAMSTLSSKMLKITSHSPLTPSKVRSVLKKIKREYGGVRMAMLDYAQLMESDSKGNTRNDELTVVSRELKRMAMQFDMPFIVLSQLTKAVETQKRKPTNGDLRETGALAQDADMILMVHRQEKYDEDSQEHQGKAEILVTKSRNGRTGSVLVGFDGPTFRFYELNGGQSWQQ